MAVWWGKFNYELTRSKLDHSFHFNWTVKMTLFVLLLPLMVHYTLLMCASITVAYAVHRDSLRKEKILSLILFLLWSVAGFVTSLSGLINLFEFKWSAIVVGLVSLFTALLLEYSLTIYGEAVDLWESFCYVFIFCFSECAKLKFSAFAHIIIIFQFMLIMMLSTIAIRLKRVSRKEKRSVPSIRYDYTL